MKLITKIFRDRETLKHYMKISVEHCDLYDGEWNHSTDEYIYYEDQFTEQEYIKLTE